MSLSTVPDPIASNFPLDPGEYSGIDLDERIKEIDDETGDYPLTALKRHRKPLTITKKIVNNMIPPTEFYLFTIYAGLGKGKSAYAIFALVEALISWYKITEDHAWEYVKGFICFHPEQFFRKLREIRLVGLHRVPGILWDDAGLWLYALEWNDPFVKQLGKYMNVARSRLASLILTTPTPNWIIKKLRGFPDAYHVRIKKTTGAPRTRWLRAARGYTLDMMPDLRKFRVNVPFEDDFNCRMPDHFFKWYSPLRDAYEELALDLMEEAFEKQAEKSSVPAAL